MFARTILREEEAVQRPPIRVVTRGTITRGGTIARATTRYGAAVHVGHVFRPSRVGKRGFLRAAKGHACVAAPLCPRRVVTHPRVTRDL